MWQDEEDNNPYGTGFERRDSTSSSVNPSSPNTHDYAHVPYGYDRPHTPSSNSEDSPGHHTHHTYTGVSDEEDFEAQPPSQTIRRKPGGYESRVEQLLYENPELPILITDAGKSVENGGRYIVYTIRTGDLEVRRRYSEFSSLRDALIRLHPTLIIPPIPEKHTMADYAANPTNAKQDQQIIDLRKRMLPVFLNRCRRMEQVLSDGVWWRFLDPNVSWNEVLNSYPVSSVPKSVLKAPPLEPAKATPAHAYLPLPTQSAKLKHTAPASTTSVSDTAGPVSGSQILQRLPIDTRNLAEEALDPAFIGFEVSSKELENLLMGSMEKVNRRTLSHLSALSTDLSDLGAKFNAFALSESDPSLAAAIERVGQAADSSYIATEELAGSLGASFAEPMRENAQFAGVVRNVLRYRILKRVQQEMTMEELAKKHAILDQLERSEQEAKRIEQYLSSSSHLPGGSQSPTAQRHSNSKDDFAQHQRESTADDSASIDSDFPPSHGDMSSVPSAKIGSPSALHRKMPSGNSITNKIFAPIRHAVQGFADVDPERSRRDQISKTRESIEHLEQAKVVAAQDVKEASASIVKDLKRFQGEKEEDLRRYMLAYAKSQIEWARKNKETWEEAKAEIDKIDET